MKIYRKWYGFFVLGKNIINLVLGRKNILKSDRKERKRLEIKRVLS